MRILITTDWYAPVINGVVTSVLNLENELRKMGHDVKVLTLSRSCKSYVDGDVTYIGSLGAGVIYPNARLKIPFKSKLVADIISWKPDIIHSQCEFSTFLFAKKIAKKLDIPLVHTYHTVYEDYTHYFSPNEKWGRKAVVRFSRWVTSACEAVIAPTDKVKQMLEGYEISCPVSVIPTGIRLDKFYNADKAKSLEIRRALGIADNDFAAVYIGRLAKEKNVEELITMHSKITDKHIKLLLVGDGPDRGAIEELVDKLDMRDRVIFAGMVKPEQVAEYYKCGDIFVSASSSETQGLTYIEALASGLPVICRKDKCLDGVVEDVMNGFQYTKSDEYIDVIETLSNEKKNVELMSKNALKSSHKFEAKLFAQRALTLYDEAIRAYDLKKYKLTELLCG